MAFRYRTITKSALNHFVKSTIPKPSLKHPTSSLPNLRSSPTQSRSISQLGCLQSLLPLHSAVSSARLISGLGIDSMSSRSMSQGMLSSANPGKWVSLCRDKLSEKKKGADDSRP